MDSGADVTQLLQAWSRGERQALDALLPLIYEQLRSLARARLKAERADHTLNTTALVHEAYLRLVDINRVQWNDRAHFLAMASRAMRRILVEYAHRRNAQRRGGGVHRAELEEGMLLSDEDVVAVLELDDVLSRLEQRNPRQVQVIEHRYFGGLSLEETAEVLGISLATVKRDLRFAQAWLARELGAVGGPPPA